MCTAITLGACVPPAVPPQEYPFTIEEFVQRRTRGHTGSPSRTLDEAAVAACEWLWANVPEAKQFEYCGVLYSTSDGVWVGLPETTLKPKRCTTPLPPEGEKTSGTYHNHLSSEDFSEVDRGSSKLISHYLCTPLKRVKRFTSGQGTVTIR